jgi:hypothetical protein
MSRSAVLLVCLLYPCAACAGQATTQFQVGIMITGQPAAPAGGSAAQPQAATFEKSRTSGSASAAKPAHSCTKRVRAFDPISGAYFIRAIKTTNCR